MRNLDLVPARIRTRPLPAAAVLLLTGLANAQCTVVPGSGCPQASSPACVIDARIGRPFQICLSAPTPTLGVSVSFASCGPMRTFAGWPLCSQAPCGIVGDLYQATSVGGVGQACLTGTVPNVPALVGQSVCVQGFYAPARLADCLGLSTALRVTIAA